MLDKTDAALASAISKMQAIAPEAWAEMVYGQVISGVAAAAIAVAFATLTVVLVRACRKWESDDAESHTWGKMLLGAAASVAGFVTVVQAKIAFTSILAPSAAAIYSVL